MAEILVSSRSSGASVPAQECEAARHADFSQVRYAQCWEDADVLLEGLDVSRGDHCLSIGSAGDNTLALLTRAPERVVAVDLNPAQIACLELRVTAFRNLDHSELLELIGSRPSNDRISLYHRCRQDLSPAVQSFWDRRPNEIVRGIGNAGKFERYFETFRNRVLPLVHRRTKVDSLLQPRSVSGRNEFYQRSWNSWRWQLIFRIFFSRFVMGRCGRDPSFFRYVEGSVSDRILLRAKHALTQLDPSRNPYLTWILRGTHGESLPLALREENFEIIRGNLHKLEWRCESIEEYLRSCDRETYDAFNLSDIFEYMSAEQSERILERIATVGRAGARLVYWNTLVDRHRPDSLSSRILSLDRLSEELHRKDQAFFYCRLIVEQVV